MLIAAFMRSVQAILTAFAASVIVWALLPLAPGNPAVRILLARGMSDYTELELEAVRLEMGLDLPLVQQFLQWLWRVLHGDLGVSFASGKPIVDEIATRLPATLILLGLALLISITLSVCFALIAAKYQDRWPDRLIRVYTQIGAALPTFIFALLALNYVVVAGNIGRVLSDAVWTAALLPAFIIGLDRASGWTQLLRAGLLDELTREYAFVARTRGASEWRVLLRYALPNAALPFLTAIGLSIGALIGGAPLIEAIFTWPGLGNYLLDALSARDFPVIQAYVLIAALSYVLAALLIDFVAIALDPRLRRQSA